MNVKKIQSTQTTIELAPRVLRSSRKPTFKARASRLDFETVNSESFSLRGFFTAFWIALAFYSINTVYRTYKNEGTLFRLNFLYHILHDGRGLFLSDCLLILSCFMCVVIQKMLRARMLPMSLAFLVQHVWQLAFLSVCIVWVFVRDWPWLQSGVFTLHAVSMMFKQHSYLATNREMEQNYRRLLKLEKEKEIYATAKQTKTRQSLQNHSQMDVDSHLEDLNADIKTLKHHITTADTQYPANLTVFNFVDYMLVPTLVYDLQYPRTDKFRLSYFMEKVAGIWAAIFLMYLTVDHYVLPVIENMHDQNFLDVVMGLQMPFMVCYFMMFYVIFEGICNAFAEMTLFADRDFYSDWWNSTTFDEFARKWNRPVHEFLLRHVYFESLETYKMSKQNATWITFLFSSCLHELVMFVVGKRVRFYLFAFQMGQLPLIYLSRMPFMKTQKLLGNIIFWVGMLLGPPLIVSCYLYDLAYTV